MPVTLCLDFGNTSKKAAIFSGNEIQEQFYLDDDNSETIEGIISTHQPEFSILSSVIIHNPEIEEILAGKTIFHKLSVATKINFSTPVGKPETIGADRVALMAAAAYYYPNQNSLIISLGSCITYNFLNQYNEFLGGGISPGLDMRFKAMHEHTALLPLVSADWNFPLIGYDTKTNLQSGVIYGMAGEIDGILSRYEERYGNFNAVLTGGNSAYFAGQIKKEIFADHNFLFKGLYALSELNNGQPA